MAEEKTTEEQQPPLSNTDLAFERTMLAAERTLMAWIRTAISMISFGFTIYKFFQDVATNTHKHQLLTPRIVGMIMILFALLGLLLAQIEYYKSLKRLRRDYPRLHKSAYSIMAVLIWVFGLVLLVAAGFRQ